MAAKLELFGAALLDGDGFWYGLVPLKAFVEGRNLGREDAGIQSDAGAVGGDFFRPHTLQPREHRARSRENREDGWCEYEYEVV